MNTTAPLEFHKARDFSKKINDTFEFLKQNFVPLTKSILFIAGPPVLMGSLMMGSFIGDFLDFTQSSIANPGSAEMAEKYFFEGDCIAEYSLPGVSVSHAMVAFSKL